jgi:cell division septum initiation protein DivIVA
MGWFTRKPDPMTARARELTREIAELETQIDHLNDAAQSSDRHQIQTVLEATPALPPDPVFRPGVDLPGTLPAEAARDCPGLFNDQGLRKFDLAGWWRRVKQRTPLPAPTPSENIVTFIASGKNHGYTSLRKERRVARNRFIILTLVLLAMLWSILSLIIPQL